MNENFKYESFSESTKNISFTVTEISPLELVHKPNSPRLVAPKFSPARLMMIFLAGLSATGLIAQNFEQPKEAKGAVLAASDISWGFGSESPCPVSAAASTKIADSLYLMGGLRLEGADCTSSPIYSNVNEKRDVDGNWSLKAPLLTRVNNADAEYVNGKVIVTGGEGVDGSSTNALKLVQIYNPDTDSWMFGPDLPKERQGHQAVAVGNKLVIMGGFDKFGVTLDSTDILDTNTMTYSPGPKMNKVRSNFGAALNEATNEIDVFQGNSGNGMIPIFGSEKLSSDLSTWSMQASSSKSRYNHQTVYLPSTGTFFSIAGQNVDIMGILKDVEEYNPATNTYSFVSSLNLERTMFAAHSVNGRIIVIGGTSDFTTKSTEIGVLAGSETATPTKTAKPATNTPTATKTPVALAPTKTPAPTNTPVPPTFETPVGPPPMQTGGFGMGLPVVAIGKNVAQ